MKLLWLPLFACVTVLIACGGVLLFSIHDHLTVNHTIVEYVALLLVVKLSLT